MPYLNNRRRARSQRSRKKITNIQLGVSPLKRVNAYRNTLAKESLLSEQRLLEEEDIKLKNQRSKKSILEILQEKELKAKMGNLLPPTMRNGYLLQIYGLNVLS